MIITAPPEPPRHGDVFVFVGIKPDTDEPLERPWGAPEELLDVVSVTISGLSTNSVAQYWTQDVISVAISGLSTEFGVQFWSQNSI